MLSVVSVRPKWMRVWSLGIIFVVTLLWRPHPWMKRILKFDYSPCYVNPLLVVVMIAAARLP